MNASVDKRRNPPSEVAVSLSTMGFSLASTEMKTAVAAVLIGCSE
jgi:hypothetical protein